MCHSVVIVIYKLLWETELGPGKIISPTTICLSELLSDSSETVNPSLLLVDGQVSFIVQIIAKTMAFITNR